MPQTAFSEVDPSEPARPATESLLTVEELRAGFKTGDGYVEVLRDVSLRIAHGESVGLVGESGCGKSVTALAILGLLPAAARLRGGRILLAGAGDLMRLPEKRWREARGSRLAMIFQEPATALNPVLTIGFQIAEILRVRRGFTRHAAGREARRLLDLVAMPDSRQRLRAYPHQLSGGQRQRAMIAMALASQPDLLIADEPTTALDVTVQAQIVRLLQDLQQELGLALLLITHDLGVVAECCERVVVMYAGEVVEQGPIDAFFRQPAHPYTRALLAAMPKLGQAGDLPEGLTGQVPEPGALPAGCPFHPRCGQKMAICEECPPRLYDLGDRRHSRCWLHEAEG